jgi:hypothetical protein
LNNASQKSPFEPKRGSGIYYQIVTKYRLAEVGCFEGLEQSLAFNLEWAIKKGAVFTAPL